MMCACDEAFGRRFLPHQLDRGVELDTQARVPVTCGFLPVVCRECRGQPPIAYPSAERFGRTTKIQRYYWREIFFETTRRMQALRDLRQDPSSPLGEIDQSDEWKQIERIVIAEFKEQHRRTPKYRFDEPPQSQVLADAGIQTIDVKATFVKTEDRKVRLQQSGDLVTAEEFAARHYQAEGFDVLVTESVPFHAMFVVFLYILLQDPFDPQGEMIGFGDRTAFEERTKGGEIWTHLPSDFGSPTYMDRRQEAIDEHFGLLVEDRDELLWAFDYWTDGSHDLRQYLWAHRPQDLETARRLVEVLSPHHIRSILRHLLEDYWHRYLGWPDLLVHNEGEFFFVEVKAGRDKLSSDQKNWIRNNTLHLQLPFQLFKIHRHKTVSLSQHEEISK